MTGISTTPWWHLYVPKLYTVLREGYNLASFRSDVLAGLTVAIVAIPLAMALGIASGTTPDKGLITAIIAGFLISALGGSRVQIGGPTGAFVVVVFNVIAQYGYDGLVLATLMAGVMLLIAGFARLGSWIKYIPQPVITGFTAGIAVIIFSSQIRDIFGLSMDKVPGDFIEKWQAFWGARDTMNIAALGVSLGALAIIIILRRYAPSIPAFLVAVVAASLAVMGFHLDIATIGSAFGGIPDAIPAPKIPEGITLARMHELLPSAFTIAFLAGIESLLSAVVADGMIDRRHKSNSELVGQGVANIASAFFGGMPATGAIARTVTNIRSGAKSPVAGMLHAVFILLAMLFCAPLASYVPLAALAAVLVVVAWNMSEQEKIRHLLHAPLGERVVMVITFFLTVAVDLTVAIEVGVVMAAILFMHRMSRLVEVQMHTALIEEDIDDVGRTGPKPLELPPGVESYRIRGPLFFGSASHLMDVAEQFNPAPKIFILSMSQVPMIDSSGEAALAAFLKRCQKKNVFVILSGLQYGPRKTLRKMGYELDHTAHYMFAENFYAAVEAAESRIG